MNFLVKYLFLPLFIPVVVVFFLLYGFPVIKGGDVSESTIIKSEVILDSFPNNDDIIFINKLLLKESQSVNSRFYQTELSDLAITKFYDNILLHEGWVVANIPSNVSFSDQEVVRRYYHTQMKFYLSIFRTVLSRKKAIILIVSLEI